MRTFFVENTSGSDLWIDDLGIQVLAATTTDLLLICSHGLLMKSGRIGSLKTLFESGDLIRKDDLGNQIYSSNNYGCDCIRDEQKILGTLSDATYEVTTTGNDNTGLGDVATPWGSVTRVLKELPQQIDHKIKVRVATGTYTDKFPLSINKTFTGDGQLLIESEMVISAGLAGPYTVSGFTEIGPAFQYNGATVTFSGTPGWAVNELRGKYLRDTSSGYLYKVVTNDSNSCVIMAWAYALGVGATVEVVEPGAKFDDAVAVTRAMRCIDLDSDPGLTAQTARLAIVGCGFSNSSSQLSLVDTGIYTSGTDLGHTLLERSNWNGCVIPDMTQITVAALRDTWQNQSGALSLWASDSFVTMIAIGHDLNQESFRVRGSGRALWCSFYGYSTLEDFGYAYIGNCLTQCSASKSNYVVEGGKFRLENSHGLAGKYYVDLDLTNVRMSNCSTDTASFSYGAGVSFGTSLELNSCSGVDGSSGDAYGVDLASAIPWPAIGSVYTDDKVGSIYTKS